MNSSTTPACSDASTFEPAHPRQGSAGSAKKILDPPGTTGQLIFGEHDAGEEERSFSPQADATSTWTPRRANRSVTVEVLFQFEAPEARSVLLVGEFGRWERTPVVMTKSVTGVWHAEVPLAPGRHLYRFLVDGAWQNDPGRAELVPNGFGMFNNVVEVH